jgi:hypothetical protein
MVFEVAKLDGAAMICRANNKRKGYLLVLNVSNCYEEVCSPLPFPSRTTKPWKWGRRGMGVSDLLPMVPVRWLGIACVHGLSLTTVSTRYTFTTTMYLSPNLPPLQKVLCCSSVVLGVSFFVVLRIEHNLGVLILYLWYARGLCSSHDGSWILQNMC